MHKMNKQNIFLTLIREILYFLKIKKRRPLSWSPTSAHWGNYVEFIEKTE